MSAYMTPEGYDGYRQVDLEARAAAASPYELVLILFGASLSLAFLGGGSYALDSQVFGYERRLAQSISTD